MFHICYYTYINIIYMLVILIWSIANQKYYANMHARVIQLVFNDVIELKVSGSRFGSDSVSVSSKVCGFLCVSSIEPPSEELCKIKS